ncbi:aminoglycoside phosphotransferase family protein [Paenibacillus sp. SZ31]|uniref:aminoglycoside phosphotransferase family protein n=1 Tax=Paenibacillus sp. SZ31 TaxID=2725555 RepID=UPI00146CE3DE|nr:aminoglycoside phosphotransferase family protein [Paenibacillus sp. SZ31]NMI03142.1 aminoglycoside phosphotransferase family protein [Paenibacillus sp. SZ31]
MLINPTINEINDLFKMHHINEEISGIQSLSGTTAGRVYRLSTNLNKQYILKSDEPEQIHIAQQFLDTYKNSSLLPEVLLTDSDNTYFIYTYMEGTTHFNRGQKRDWLSRLVKELFNTYVRSSDTESWGRIEFPQRTWKEFNQISVQEAKMNLGSILTTDDYNLVQSIVDRLFHEQEEKFLLHGDTGVHNFVFAQNELIGVIDPSPMVGPILYDFLYAFSSSPDDINTETLFATFELLEQVKMDKSRLIEEALVHLYCRIGLSNKHHPDDLPKYLKAWQEWKRLCQGC